MWKLPSIIVLLILGNIASAGAQSPKFVELVESDKPYHGKIVARSKDQVWLLERSGRLHTLSVNNITTFRKLGDSFTPVNAVDLRDDLRRELGKDFEVVGTGQYLVAGPPGVVREYAEVFEDQYRAVYQYFSLRGLDVHEPEFPLVAIVFPDPVSFRQYAQGDNIVAGAGLKGYYIQSTNRVALFHETPAKTTRAKPPSKTLRLNPFSLPDPQTARLDLERLKSNGVWATTDGDLRSTMIHETTHQVAFNIGIHSRIGSVNPRWIVEGLATTFEAPGMRSTSLANTPGAKLNQMRLANFREFRKLRRKPNSLEEYLRSDQGFGENVLDGYAQAWALTYYLVETRPREFSRLIKLIAARPQLEPYEDEQRLEDFRSAFGNSIDLLEAKFLRFMADVK